MSAMPLKPHRLLLVAGLVVAAGVAAAPVGPSSAAPSGTPPGGTRTVHVQSTSHLGGHLCDEIGSHRE